MNQFPYSFLTGSSRDISPLPSHSTKNITPNMSPNNFLINNPSAPINANNDIFTQQYIHSDNGISSLLSSPLHLHQQYSNQPLQHHFQSKQGLSLPFMQQSDLQESSATTANTSLPSSSSSSSSPPPSLPLPTATTTRVSTPRSSQNNTSSLSSFFQDASEFKPASIPYQQHNLSTQTSSIQHFFPNQGSNNFTDRVLQENAPTQQINVLSVQSSSPNNMRTSATITTNGDNHRDSSPFPPQKVILASIDGIPTSSNVLPPGHDKNHNILNETNQAQLVKDREQNLHSQQQLTPISSPSSSLSSTATTTTDSILLGATEATQIATNNNSTLPQSLSAIQQQQQQPVHNLLQSIQSILRYGQILQLSMNSATGFVSQVLTILNMVLLCKYEVCSLFRRPFSQQQQQQMQQSTSLNTYRKHGILHRLLTKLLISPIINISKLILYLIDLILRISSAGFIHFPQSWFLSQSSSSSPSSSSLLNNQYQYQFHQSNHVQHPIVSSMNNSYPAKRPSSSLSLKYVTFLLCAIGVSYLWYKSSISWDSSYSNKQFPRNVPYTIDQKYLTNINNDHKRRIEKQPTSQLPILQQHYNQIPPQASPEMQHKIKSDHINTTNTNRKLRFATSDGHVLYPDELK